MKEKGTLKNYEEEALCAYRNECAIKLFNKLECELQIAEIVKLDEYIHDLANPVWKPIMFDGKKTHYVVSNTGLVANLFTNRILRPHLDKDGYCRVSISITPNSKYCGIHRLVAQAFIPNPENKPEVNHINAVKDCNWYKNLEWVTQKENIEHAREMGLEDHIGLRGEENSRNIYTEAQIRKVCEMLEDPKYAPGEISKVTGVDTSSIHLIKNGKNWAHISKDYKFHNKSFKYGIDNPSGKYDDETIHKICKLLEDPNNNPSKVAKMVGVPVDLVGKIYNGHAHKNISSQYNIQKRDMTSSGNWINCKYTVEEIRNVCKELQNPYISYPEVADKTGVDFSTVANVAKGKQWKPIVQEFPPIPKRINPKTESILKLYDQGYTYTQIYEKLQDKFFNGIDRRKGTMQIGGIIRERGLNKMGN